MSKKVQRTRIGIDLGGTKIEAMAMDEAGHELARHRIHTPRDDYQGTVQAMAGLVQRIEAETGRTASVGAGIPGTVSIRTGLVKNSNSTWLNGQPLHLDLAAILGREIRMANDANCFAVSEATDGAARGRQTVFAVILGTGCGGGLAINGHVHVGSNGVGGEWGHNPLPYMRPEEFPGPHCYCGKFGCLETWISGTGLARDHKQVTGTALSGPQIIIACEAGDPAAVATMERYEDRVARGLAHLINIVDPDVIVLGGGLSKVERIYQNVPAKLAKYVFGGEVDTPVVQALHGDSSGVRGAAWLWPAGE